jgi:hypothetical protein
MRLAWFTPFSHSSAVGRFSQAVTAELSKHASIDLWINDPGDLLPASLRVVQYGSEGALREPPRSETYDFAVWNYEEQPGFHRIDFEFSGHKTSIGISADFVINQFLPGYYQLALDSLNRSLRSADSRPVLKDGALNTPPADYAVCLLRFLYELRRLKPVIEPLRRTAATLAELGVEPDMDIVRTVAGMSADMFCRFADEAPWNIPK